MYAKYVNKPPVWLKWVYIYAFYEKVFNKLFEADFENLELMLQVLEFRNILKEYIPYLNTSGLKDVFFTEGPADYNAFLEWFSKLVLKTGKQLLE